MGMVEARPETPTRLQIANEAQSAPPQVLEVEALRLRPSGGTSHTTSRFSLRGGFPAGPLEACPHNWNSRGLWRQPSWLPCSGRRGGGDAPHGPPTVADHAVVSPVSKPSAKMRGATIRA